MTDHTASTSRREFVAELQERLAEGERSGFKGVCSAWSDAIAAAVIFSTKHATINDDVSVDEIVREIRLTFEPSLDASYSASLRESVDSPFAADLKNTMDQAISLIVSLENAACRGTIEAIQLAAQGRGAPSFLDCRIQLTLVLSQLARLARVHGPNMPKPVLITLAVATQRYCVSRKTLQRAFADGRLTDQGKSGASLNAPRQVDEANVAALWPRRS